VELGCLFSSSGTMADIEGRLNFLAKMAAKEINARGSMFGSTHCGIGPTSSPSPGD
jgi:urea transport system substrate-binding protein